MPRSFLRRVIVDVSIIIGSFIIFGVAFYLMSHFLTAKADSITADRNTISSRALALENLGQLRADAEAAEEFQQKFDALLPGQDALISFPQFLENMARVHSLDLNVSFAGSPSPPSQSAPGQVSFTASLEGSPRNIQSFVNDLERETTRFMINLDEIDFTASAAGSGANLKGKVFFK